MTFKVSDNQYGWPHPSDSWAFCLRNAIVKSNQIKSFI